MGRTRTRGITLESDGTRTVDKTWRRERVFARLGQVSQEDAENWLAGEIERRKTEQLRRGNNRPLFRECAGRYLIEVKDAPSFEVIAWHIETLLPYIGELYLDLVCDDALEDYKEDRLVGGIVAGKKKQPLKPASATTVNRALEVVRTILNRAARAWRSNGKPLLSMAPPLITMLAENRRKPYPISWEEQDVFFPMLASHLQRMALFGVNTGLRDENICGLRWDWEQSVPEVERSVFIIPAEHYKTQVPHVVVLNDVAWSVVEERRAAMDANNDPKKDTEFVFSIQDHKGYHRVDTMNNGGWQRAREDAGIPMFRVHDCRHTFGARLRAAGVTQELSLIHI